MSHTPYHKPHDAERVRPLSGVHRILRVLRGRELTVDEVFAHVADDGHALIPRAGIHNKLWLMRQRGLVVYALDSRQTTALYGLTDPGARVLRTTDELVQAALDAQATGARPGSMRIPTKAENDNVWDNATPHMRALLAHSMPRRGSATSSEQAPVYRPGSQDHEAVPSRFGDVLRYRDGRVTDLAGNPINPQEQL